MLTFTAIFLGLLIAENVFKCLRSPVKDVGDVLAAWIGLAFYGVIVWQFYFVMLPLAWGAE